MTAHRTMSSPNTSIRLAFPQHLRAMLLLSLILAPNGKAVVQDKAEPP